MKSISRLIELILAMLLLNSCVYDKSEWYYERGLETNKMGFYKEAIQDYNKAIELNPDLTHAYAARGYSKYLLEDWSGALEDLNKNEINSCDYYLIRGIVKFSLSLDQQFSHEILNIGLNESILDFSKSIELCPNNIEAIIYRGIANYELGYDDISAIEDFNKAISLDPKVSSAYIARSIVKNRMGDKKGANKDLYTAATLGSLEAGKLVNKDFNYVDIEYLMLIYVKKRIFISK